MTHISHHYIRTFANMLTLAQFPLTVMFIVYLQEPVTVLTSTHVTNISSGFLPDDIIDVEVESYHMSSVYLLSSVCTFFFGFVTKQQYVFDMQATYSIESAAPVTIWSLLFWISTLLYHVILVAFFISPCEWSLITLIVIFHVYIMHRITEQQLQQIHHKSEENFLMIFFAILLMLTYYYIHVKSGNVVMLYMCMVGLDILLLMGHTYDKDPTMEVIGNCRLYYVVCMTALVLFSYTL